jgi:hypothetical protein
MEESMKGLNHEELQITIAGAGSGWNMKWLGKSRNPNPSAILLPYLDGVVNELNEGDKLEVNFKDLDFMNSSTVTSIIQLIKNLEKKNITTEVLYKARLEWQAACFKALDSIVRNYKNIKVKGE